MIVFVTHGVSLMKKNIYSLLTLSFVLVGGWIQEARASFFQEDLTLLSAASLFVTSLSPVTAQDAAHFKAFCANQASQLCEKPASYVADTVSLAAKKTYEHPMDAATLLVAGTGLNEVVPYVNEVVQGLQYFKMGAQFYPLVAVENVQDFVEKGLKIAAIASAVYALEALPAAAALKYTSVADARAAYSGGPCPDKGITNAISCIDAGEGHGTCLSSNNLPQSASADEYFFTRHVSASPNLDPVSITSIGDNQTCIQTALSANAPVTQVCFSDMHHVANHTTQVLEQMTLSRAQVGLESGASAHHMAVNADTYGCGITKVMPTTPIAHDVTPTCLLSATGPQDDVTKLCFDPQKPGMPVVTRLEAVEEGILVPVKGHQIMTFQDSDPQSVMYLEGAPLPSVVCLPEEMPAPVVVVRPLPEGVSPLETAVTTPLVPYKGSLSLWGSLSGAFKCWFYGINPCVLEA